MNSNINLQAYNSIEQLSEYTPEALAEYRSKRLDRYQQHADFILSKSGNLPVSIIEIGSGSSVLLYAVAERNRLKSGMGIELSKSRSEFAEQWKKDKGYDQVKNVNSNFVGVDMGQDQWDWFIVIDNTFTYLFPEDPQYPAILLDKAYASLKDNGRIVLDFINYAKRSPGREYKLWSAFSENDPYSYGLYSNKITDGVNRSESIFIKRDGSGAESTKIELCKVYSLEDVSALLKDHGFTVDEVFSSFDMQPFIGNMSDRLVVVAKKIPA